MGGGEIFSKANKTNRKQFKYAALNLTELRTFQEKWKHRRNQRSSKK